MTRDDDTDDGADDVDAGGADGVDGAGGAGGADGVDGAGGADGVAGADGADAADEDQWRFSVDEVGPDGVTEETSPGGDPIEPEGVDPEHALFVALGVVLSLGVVVIAVL